MMRRLPYETWDVFTDRRFAGNPLAVVFGADALPTEDLQLIAREFDYSESVFVLESNDDEVDARIRIFTPTGELPFAGHPTVGAACALARSRGGGSALQLELAAGRFPIRLSRNGMSYAEFQNPNRPRLLERDADPAAIERALGLPKGSVASDAYRPRFAGAGIDFLYARVDRTALDEARLNTAAWDALGLGDACGVFAWSSEDPARGAFSARMFAPHIGVAEDPATGSAAAGLPAHLVSAGALDDGRHEWSIEQGRVMGRPSRIFVRLTVHGGVPRALRVGGHAVPVMTGTIEV